MNKIIIFFMMLLSYFNCSRNKAEEIFSEYYNKINPNIFHKVNIEMSRDSYFIYFPFNNRLGLKRLVIPNKNGINEGTFDLSILGEQFNNDVDEICNYNKFKRSEFIEKIPRIIKEYQKVGGKIKGINNINSILFQFENELLFYYTPSDNLNFISFARENKLNKINPNWYFERYNHDIL